MMSSNIQCQSGEKEASKGCAFKSIEEMRETKRLMKTNK